MSVEVFSDGLGVREMAFHAQAEGFDALEDHEGVERRDGHAEVAEHLHAGFQDHRAVAKGRPVGEAVVARVGFGEVGKRPEAP